MEQLLKRAIEEHSPPEGQPERRRTWIEIEEAITEHGTRKLVQRILRQHPSQEW